MIAPEEIHRTTYHSSPVNERITLSFDREYLSFLLEICGSHLTDYIFRNSKITVPKKNRLYIEELIQKMEYESTGQDGYSLLMKRNYLHELFIYPGARR